MNKLLASSVIALTLASASAASAQSYYGPSYGISPMSTYSGGCVNLTGDLAFGAKGSQVTHLQNFLVAQNYPGSGSWMVTGYFGQATLAAVRDFQQTQGLPTTGIVDAGTRAAISNASCRMPGTLLGQGNAYNWNWNAYTPTYPNYGAFPSYPSNYYGQVAGGFGYGSCGTFPYFYSCQNYNSAPTLSSLSATSGTPGTPITVYGSGFDAISNSVYVGGTTLSNVPSANGSMLTFNLPSVTGGAVSISVGNSRGTSNALTFNVIGVPGPCGAYPYENCTYPTYPPTYPPTQPCATPYNCPQGQMSINYLTPQSGAVGTNVTIFGYGFTSSNNTVHFGNGIIANLRSFDGTSLSFSVPSTLSGFGYQPIGLGTYNVSVTNGWGSTSNPVPFTITALSGSNATSITNVTGPTSLGVGQGGTWSLTLNVGGSSFTSVSVDWGDTGFGYMGAGTPQIVTGAGAQTITFTHVYQNQGTYTITFTASNQSGQQNSATATISVGGTSAGSVTLSSIAPTSGHVGTQIILSGSGFTSDNTIHFGTGGMMHAYSQNGTTLYYTVPSYLSPCDVTPQGGVCAQYLQPVLPGSYPVYITNSAGATQQLTFQVNY
jgi:hypothetical protein